MLIDALARNIRESEALAPVYDKLDAGQDASLGIAGSARALIVASRFADTPQALCVVVAGEQAACSFAKSVAAYVGSEAVLHFPARSDYPFAPKPPDAREVAQRAAAAWALQHGQQKIVVASGAALIRELPPVADNVYAPLVVTRDREVVDASTGELLTFEEVSHQLVSRGFQNTGDVLEGPGTFCAHGGAIDINCGTMNYPVRMDFFGDEVDDIRRIVASTGQTISSLESIEIYPVREYCIDERRFKRAARELVERAQMDPVWRGIYDQLQTGTDHDGIDVALPQLYGTTATLADYVPADALMVLNEPRSIIDDAAHAYEDACSRSEGSHIPVDGLYRAPAELDFGRAQRLTLASLMRAGGLMDVEIPVKRSDVAGDTEKLVARLKALADQRYALVFSVPNLRAREDMKLLLVDNAVPFNEILDAAPQAIEEEKRLTPAQAKRQRAGSDHPYWHRDVSALKRGIVNIVDVDIALGMVIPAAKVALISVYDLNRRTSSVRNRQRIDVTEITFPFAPGDYVVHAVHGVALFKELVRQEVSGVERDYLLLQYAQGDALYVPVDQLDRVTRYVGPEGASPRLTRLNTSDWSRQLGRARKAAKKLAFDLVDVYTRRASVQGYRFGADTPWQQEMEAAFPYVETPDQLAAIRDVKADMMSAKPMDRLVCGDVGFGKTEVALRAAFKATQDSKQVMVLCPTTILAQQHYLTFKDRFDGFGVNVQVLSRFRTPAEIKAALAGFADGSVDVLVGTHRLLSRDVNPHDLGLVIIDEEQRFGVAHKEQMKNLREQIDVLTLSATPIPRTMQMSLSGVRDMSLILTPPDNRKAVEVHVGEWDVDVVSAAIRRELQRAGQVYYVSNRVRTIQDAVARVGEAAGEARIGVAHGQMTREELERVMEDFSAGAIDVLVATTIIESGIDNPHTNTLIIEDAQRLGLAQMYQLKGRVGRSNAQAYAYFMFPEGVALTEEATRRLEAINEHQDLGSGMRIAMKDLEIRGAGDLLGAEQSGNMSAVGFDLFAQMIASAVNNAQAGMDEGSDVLPAALSDITVNIPVHAYVPEEYMPQTDERVLLYRRIACADTVSAVDDLLALTREKHPDMPDACLNLFLRAKCRAWANEVGVKGIVVTGGKLTLEPLDVSKPLLASLKHDGVRYLPQSKKLSVPMAYFQEGGSGYSEEGLLQGVWELLIILCPLDGEKPLEMPNGSAAQQSAPSISSSSSKSSSAKRSKESLASKRATRASKRTSTPSKTTTKPKLNIPTPPGVRDNQAQQDGKPAPFTPTRPATPHDGRPASNGTKARSYGNGARSAAGRARGARRRNW